MGQSAHPGRRTGWTAALTASVVLAAGAVLSGCSSPVSAHDTALRHPVGVTVVHPDGSTAPGAPGLRLHPGDVVRTAAAGRAELVTDDRVVYVGSQAAVEVLDGARQSLRTGAVVVDALRGPGLDLGVAGLQVDVPAGAATRAERLVTIRVGALAGAARLTSSTGRRLTVPALHQTTVAGDALPDTSTPLRLTDDDGEAHTVPGLVRDDQTLLGIARGMDGTGRSTVRAVDANWTHGPLSAPEGVGRSERLLPAVIAAAGPAGGELQRYDRAVGYRAAGGSWGVVAHLVGVPAHDVVTTLAAFSRELPAGHVGSVRQILATAAAGDDHAGAGGQPSPAPSSGGNGPGGPGGDGNGGNGGNPSPTPSPTPSSGGIVGTVDKTVDHTLDTVLSLLPTPPPTTAPSTAPSTVVTVPGVPLPAVTLPGLPRLP